MVDQIGILLDNPPPWYFPGQTVSGRIIVRGNADTKAKGLTLRFVGYVSTRWRETHTKSQSSSNSHSGSRTESIEYHAHEEIVDMSMFVLGDGQSEVIIPRGEPSYQFSFNIPTTNFPSSFHGMHGRVEYALEANLILPWKFDKDAREIINIFSIVDLNSFPEVAQPVQKSTSKTFCCCCCASGPLTMNIRIRQTGFTPGEIMSLEVEVNNLSRREITDISIDIFQTTIYRARNSIHYKRYCGEIAGVGRGKGVRPGDTDIWQAEMMVPPIPPSKLGGCRFIDVEYEIIVTAHVSGMAFSLKESIPILIGTVPLQRSIMADQIAILLDNPPPWYFPGQTVSGRIVVMGNSDTKTKGLTLRFVGFLSVHWTESHTKIGSHNGSTENITNYAHEDIVDMSMFVLGNGQSEVIIPRGQPSYQFSFNIPATNFPSSFQGFIGRIEYALEATLLLPWNKFNKDAREIINIFSIVDLNSFPEVAQPVHKSTSKTFCCCCCASGPLTMNVRISQTGFTPGELMSLVVEVSNLSRREVTDLSMDIYQTRIYRASNTIDSNVGGEVIAGVGRGQGVRPGDTDIWQAVMMVPPIPPSRLGGCRYIDVHYEILVTAHVSGMAFSLKESIPIFIGTVPLRRR